MSENCVLGFDRIRLKSFLPVVHIYEYEADFQPNEHACAYVKVLLNGDLSDGILEERAEGKKITVVELDAEGKENRYPLFCGLIRELRLHRISEHYEAELFLVSGSWLLDQEKKSRSFQDAEMEYAEAAAQVLEDTEHGASLYTADPGISIGRPLIQYQETDWAFLKRIASHVGGVLVPDTNMSWPRIYMGMPVGDTIRGFSEDRYEVSAERREVRKQDKTVAKQAVFSYHVEDSRNASLGDNTQYQGKSLKIYRKKSRIERGELIHSYQLASPDEMRPERESHDQIRGMSLLGTVLETDGERLRLHLDMDEEQEKDSAFFYPWRPETGNLMYCMPQVGTKVSLYMGEGDEGAAIAINCVRTNGDSCEGMRGPSHRGLLTEHGKEMSFQKDSLGFYSGGEREHSIVLDDEKGIQIHSEGEILIKAKGKVSLTAVDGIFLSSPSEILALAGRDLLGNPQSGFRINHTIDFGGTQTVLTGRERTAYPLIQDAPEKGQVDWDTLLMNFAFGTVVTVVFVGVGIFTGSIPLIFGGITAGVKTISITIEDGFGGNVRKPNEFLGKVLGASARSVYTGYAIQMGPISFLGVGYLSMFGGVLERGIEGLISGYGLKGSWNYAIEDGRVLSDFAGGLLFAGLTVVTSKLLGAFLYGGSRENYYTKSIIPELPYQGYGLTPGGMQLPQGMEAGRGSREAAAFLMNLWQMTGQNRVFLPGSKPLELGDGSNKGSGKVSKPGDSDFVGPLPNEPRKITGEYQVTENLKNHIENIDTAVPRKRGIGGAHNKEVFLQNDVEIVNEIPNSSIKGVSSVEYQMPKCDKTGTPIPGEYQTGTPKIKTVYDPEIISTGEYLERGLEAANNAAKQYQNGVLPREWTGVDSQGIRWRGYSENGEITSFFPE